MKRLILFILILLASDYIIADVRYNEWWQKGNDHYNRKNYDSAAFYYELLAAARPGNAELYYNMGNTFYKLNRVGPAVLYYERALFYEPGFTKAKDNLALTQSRINNRIQDSQDVFFISWWKSISSPALANTWSLVALLLFIATLSLVLMGRWNKLPSWMNTRLSFFTGLLCICAIYISYRASENRVTHDEAVIMIQDTPIRADLKSTKTQSLIPEGTVVTLEERQQDWVRIGLPDGRSGWVRETALEVI